MAGLLSKLFYMVGSLCFLIGTLLSFAPEES
jgi:hypothetical protein